MGVYHYKAASPEGEVTEGEMKAQSRDAVIERLQALGYVPIRAEERGEAKADRPRFSFKLRGGTSPRRSLCAEGLCKGHPDLVRPACGDGGSALVRPYPGQTLGDR